MSIFYLRTVTRLRAEPATDIYGNAIDRDWANAERTDIRINAQPLSGDQPGEEVGDRANHDGYLKLISPRGADLPLLGTDRLEVDGVVYEVDGDPTHYYSAGRLHHAEGRAVIHRG